MRRGPDSPIEWRWLGVLREWFVERRRIRRNKGICLRTRHAGESQADCCQNEGKRCQRCALQQEFFCGLSVACHRHPLLDSARAIAGHRPTAGPCQIFRTAGTIGISDTRLKGGPWRKNRTQSCPIWAGCTARVDQDTREPSQSVPVAQSSRIGGPLHGAVRHRTHQSSQTDASSESRWFFCQVPCRIIIFT